MAEQTITAKKSANNKWIFLGIGIFGCVIFTCFAAFLYITFFGGKLLGGSIAGADFAQPAEEFMRAMSQGDVEKAYQFISLSGQKNISKADLEEIVKQGLFSEYAGFEVRSWNRDNYCDAPQPEGSNSLGGRIKYNDNRANDFSSYLKTKMAHGKSIV